MADSNSVLVNELRNVSGAVLAHARLNVESTLNALSLEMIQQLHTALSSWSARDDVAAIVITGSGDKAFCAGGDIQALYRAISANHAAGKVVDAYPFEFFEQEYRLDYALHTCAKPVITIGHGIVMGGGLGILGASRFRVLSEKSRLAVPEITIGLFPDAGASWTLKNMPGHYASWLGMTGSHILAADGLATGMGTHVVAHAGRDALVQDLSQFAWRNDAEADAQMIEE